MLERNFLVFSQPVKVDISQTSPYSRIQLSLNRLFRKDVVSAFKL